MRKQILFTGLLFIWSIIICAQSNEYNYTQSLIPRDKIAIENFNTSINSLSNNEDIVILEGNLINVEYKANKSILIKPESLLSPSVGLVIEDSRFVRQKTNNQIEYYDGLGRPIQAIAIGAGSTNDDIVSYYYYDQFGRNTKQYLPYSAEQSNGLFIDGLSDLISNSYLSEFGETHPYSETLLQSSPLSRVIETSIPGSVMAIVPESDNDHTQKMSYSVNSSNEVYKYTNRENNDFLDFDLGFYKEGELSRVVVKNQNWKTIDGKLNTTEVYKDKSGKIILEKKYVTIDAKLEELKTQYVYDKRARLLNVIPPAAIRHIEEKIGENSRNKVVDYRAFLPVDFSGAGGGSGNIYINDNGGLEVTISAGFSETQLKIGKVANLFIGHNIPDQDLGVIDSSVPYNQNYMVSIESGYIAIHPTYSAYPIFMTSFNCSFTIPLPDNFQLATDGVFDQSNILEKYITQYRYDDYNRKIAQRKPSKDWEYFVYDKLDNPILMQDANLRAQDLWVFTKYDAFNRVVYTGKYISAKSRENLQIEVDTYIDTNGNPANIENKIINTSIVAGTTINYSNIAFPVSGIQELLAVNYYDDYEFTDADKPILPTSVEGQDVAVDTKTLLTSSWVKILGSSSWKKSYYYFDEYGRQIRVYERNRYGGHTQTDQVLSFLGEVLYSITTHQKQISSDVVTIKDSYEHDHVGRLLLQKQKINSLPEERIAEYEYNEIGKLISKNVGGTISGSGLQQIDYKYDIRGWLKEVNDVNSIGNDVFAYKLLHQEDAIGSQIGSKLYDGNIRQIVWKSKYDVTKKTYKYFYDQLNQLRGAYYDYGESLSSNNISKFNISVGYDLQGNIKSLYRYGGNGQAVDDLDFHYDLPGQDRDLPEFANNIHFIVESSSGAEGFTNSASNFFDYDDNGNLIQDDNRNISSIEYNHLDLIEKITFSDGRYIDFVYDASGNKLSKTYFDGSSPVTTDYLGAFQYIQGNLSFFPTSEGYVRYDATLDAYDYFYVFRDHLGNNRVSYTDLDKNGLITTDELLSSTDYYPMGMPHSGQYISSLAANYNYQYQGKELQTDNNLRYYDFHARMYDATTGRWFNTDPKDVHHSPYLAMGNNFTVTIDPDGQEPIIIAALFVGIAMGSYALYTNWDNIDNFWEGAAVFTAGGLSGAATVYCGGCGTVAVMAIGFGGGVLTGATNNIVAQVDDDTSFDEVKWKETMQVSAINGVAGGLSAGAGKWMTGNYMTTATVGTMEIQSPLVASVVKSTVGGTVGGVVGGGVTGLLMTGSWEGAMDGMYQGGRTGFMTGAAFGAGFGVYSSIQNKVNPFTGKPIEPYSKSSTNSSSYDFKKAATEAASSRQEKYNFGLKAGKHFDNPSRKVPVQIMDEVISNTKAFPDPRGSRASMYYSPMMKNGKMYNFEILYDKSTNSIWHFKYDQRALGPLPAIKD